MKRRNYKNKYGLIPNGTYVHFEMENPSMWGGDTTGILLYDENIKKWVIGTNKSGIIGIGGYLEAYPQSIRPL